MLLKERTFGSKEWNKKIMPAIKSGKIIERKDLIEPGFLMVYQLFDSFLEEEGTVFSVTGWETPELKTYVEVKRI